MSLQKLALTQNSLAASIKHFTQLTHQLSTLQFQAPAGTGPDGTPVDPEELRVDLTAEIHAGVKQCEEDLDLLQQDVEDLESAAPRPAKRRSGLPVREAERHGELGSLNTGCVKLREDIKHLHARFRKAQLQAKSNAAHAAQKERAAYLSSLQAAATAYSTAVTPAENDSTDTNAPQQPRYTNLFAGRRAQKARDPHATNDDILLTASSDVTASLKRTHGLLTSELSRSQFASETLAASNAALEELNTRYSSFGDLVTKSSGLLGTLLRSQKSDTWYLETALYALLATLAWLVFRRLLYGPLWLFVAAPLRIVYSVLATVLSLVGVGGRGGAASTALARTTALGTATVSVPPVAAHSTVASSADMPGESVHPLSDAVGSAAEAAPTQPGDDDAGREQEQQQGQQGQQRQQVVRGDGAVLPDRDEAAQPRNPKKRVLEEPPPPPPAQGEQGRKKDEL